MRARRAETLRHHQTRHGCEARTKVPATVTLHHIKWHDYLSLPPSLLILLQLHISHPLCLWDYTSNLSLPYQPLLWQLPASAERWEYIGRCERARVQYLYPASAGNYRADLASNNRRLTQMRARRPAEDNGRRPNLRFYGRCHTYGDPWGRRHVRARFRGLKSLTKSKAVHLDMRGFAVVSDVYSYELALRNTGQAKCCGFLRVIYFFGTDSGKRRPCYPCTGGLSNSSGTNSQ